MARILIVDDDPSFRGLMVEILSEDHEVLAAENGEAALALIREESGLDLLVTDLVMPTKNGIDLIMQLRKENPRLRILAVSGGGGITGRFDYLPVARLVGANVILPKPFDVDQLRQCLGVCGLPCAGKYGPIPIDQGLVQAQPGFGNLRPVGRKTGGFDCSGYDQGAQQRHPGGRGFIRRSSCCCSA